MDIEGLTLPRLRRMFYLISPAESSFSDVADVPDYVFQAVPFFTLFGLMEMLYFHVTSQGHKFPINDGVMSVANGAIYDLSKLLVITCEIAAYAWTYNHFNIISLPWDSPLTWWLCFLGVDLGYYWFHRAAHEVNILWASHQVHHSSEYYNLSTALRQSILQQLGSWIFYLPMALFIPPSIFLAHIQFNLIYQFWIHTGLVSKLGPLEYVLNTPSHHRVHHGRNRYCIDKNYGGTLIIWDRMFGTFEAENEEVVFGLTHPISSFDPFWIQFAHLNHIINTFKETKGIGNKLSVIFKGPGWGEGKPRLGLIEDIPDVHAPEPQYDPIVPVFWQVYVYLHNMISILGAQELHNRLDGFNQLTVLLFVLFILFSFTTYGAIFDNKPYGGYLEVIRCIIYLLGSHYFGRGSTSFFLRLFQAYFYVSILIWVLYYARAKIQKSTKTN